MSTSDSDRRFAGSIPAMYEHYFVPLIFAPYAPHVAERVAARRPRAVLEIAAGTGAATRALAARLAPGTHIVATDLNEPMLRHGEAIGTAQPVTWRQADAMALPFADGSFDAVVCQFGAMFFPDRAAAYAETYRVLRPGGAFVFAVWDAIEANEFTDVVTQALGAMFPDDPPRFMVRTPHGYHDRATIGADVSRGGFTQGATIDVVDERSRAASARDVAVALCQGSPLRNEIEARDPTRLEEATERAAAAIAERFGPGPVDGLIRALIVEAGR